MRLHLKPFLLFVAATLLLVLPASYVLTEGLYKSDDEQATRVLIKYLRDVYSRDFKHAYQFVSEEDKRLKNEGVYVQERGPFSGFTLEVSKKLSEFIKFTPVQIKINDNRARITLGFKAPDMNGLSALMLDWDEERLNALPPPEQKKLLASIDALKRRGSLEMIEGQEEFNLVREGNNWRLFFDWASGIKVNFITIVPQDGTIEAKPTIKETVIQPNELFSIAYRVKNLTDNEVFARITHRVQPEGLKEHLDLVECGLLLPVRIPPRQEQTYSSTYVVRGDMGTASKSLDVTYEFKVEH